MSMVNHKKYMQSLKEIQYACKNTELKTLRIHNKGKRNIMLSTNFCNTSVPIPNKR